MKAGKGLEQTSCGTEVCTAGRVTGARSSLVHRNCGKEHGGRWGQKLSAGVGMGLGQGDVCQAKEFGFNSRGHGRC